MSEDNINLIILDYWTFSQILFTTSFICNLSMKLKYYIISLFFSLFFILLAFIFIAPYGLNFKGKEQSFNEATILISFPNRGEKKIKFEAGLRSYWLSCYGLDDLCRMENLNKKFPIINAKILLLKTNDTNFLNGVLVSYYKNDIFYSNKKITKDVNLLEILAYNSVFCLKLAVFFLLLSLFFFIKRI